jgi:arylsulfatase A-like enzyme
MSDSLTPWFDQVATAPCTDPFQVRAVSIDQRYHRNNFGSIAGSSIAFPGNTGSRPNNVVYGAEMLRLNGYSTAWFGKNHETAAWEVSLSGPTDRWPTRSGFDKFYGFMGGETNQWAPFVYDGMTPVEIPEDPNTIDGVSRLYSFNNAKAPDTHKTQYFEIFGNRGVSHDGWFAGTTHRPAWKQLPTRPLKEDIWELYDTKEPWEM